jgi:hypothetical protein
MTDLLPCWLWWSKMSYCETMVERALGNQLRVGSGQQPARTKRPHSTIWKELSPTNNAWNSEVDFPPIEPSDETPTLTNTLIQPHEKLWSKDSAKHVNPWLTAPVRWQTRDVSSRSSVIIYYTAMENCYRHCSEWAMSLLSWTSSSSWGKKHK